MSDRDPKPFRFKQGDLLTVEHVNTLLERLERLESIVRRLQRAEAMRTGTIGPADTEIWDIPPADF